MRRAKTFGLAILCAVFASVALHSYVPLSAKWNTLTVNYYVNATTPDLSPSAALAGVQAGASAWGSQSSSPFSFYYQGSTTGTTVQNNGKNEVFFRQQSNGNVIATTYYWSSLGLMLDADIVFWDGGFAFFQGSGCSNGMYVDDVGAHEFGHMAGLGHTSVGGATMYPSIGYCSTGPRTLEADDKAGLEFLYPPAGDPPPASLPGIPSSPTPPNGSTRRSVNQNIGWTSAGATSYDVYFGATSNPPKLGTVTTNSYNLPRLSAHTQYWWRIIAKNPAGNTTGPLWTFTTR